jgi:hypothetical protein
LSDPSKKIKYSIGQINKIAVKMKKKTKTRITYVLIVNEDEAVKRQTVE